MYYHTYLVIKTILRTILSDQEYTTYILSDQDYVNSLSLSLSTDMIQIHMDSLKGLREELKRRPLSKVPYF